MTILWIKSYNFHTSYYCFRKKNVCERKKFSKFPKDFWKKERKIISTKEALKDVIPFEWSKDVLSGKKEAILKSPKAKI